MRTASFWGTAVLVAGLALPLFVARRDLAMCQQQKEELQAQSHEVLYRIQAKRTVVEDVIGGRMTLREAAAQFAELNAICPTYMNLLRQLHPGLSDEEVLCRNVMSFVATELSHWPDQAACVLARLEKELTSEDLHASAMSR
jgi:hypothetical protein